MLNIRAAMGGVLAISVLSISGVRAQTVARPEFDAASIRPSDSGPGMVTLLNPGRLTYRKHTLEDYIWLAYDLQPYQLTRVPAVSLDDLISRYDIVAKATEPVPMPQVKLMLQSLLADRFKLAMHKETKELSAYILIVDKGGPRFKASDDEGPTVPLGIKDDGVLRYRRASMAYLTFMLTNLPSLGGRPVVDGTGLGGIYDISMKLFDPDLEPGNSHQQLDDKHDEWLKALGLKLVPQRTSIEILVVDHVEKPSPN